MSDLPDYNTHLVLNEDVPVLGGARTVWKGTEVRFVDEVPDDSGDWFICVRGKHSGLPMVIRVNPSAITRLGD